MPKPMSKQYVGLDVSLAETSIAVIDENDKVVWRGKVASTPEAIAEALKKHAPRAERVGLESRSAGVVALSRSQAKGWPVFCIDARHAKAALSLKVNKTDANDALGLAQIMRVGWYREVDREGARLPGLRALLIARAQIVSQITTLKNCVRGILKMFGRVLPKGCAPPSSPACERRSMATRRSSLFSIQCCGRWRRRWSQLQVYDRAAIRHARERRNRASSDDRSGRRYDRRPRLHDRRRDPARFSRSTSVGAYFGMTPKRYQSGEVDKAGRVSKCGDGMVRGLLFEAAKVLLSRSAKPSDLQAWGRALAKRIGSKKATMAVARKLAVILHRMWTTGKPFRWTATPVPTAA